MLIDKNKIQTNAHFRRLARQLLQVTEEKRKSVLSSVPTEDRLILLEMIKKIEADRPLLKE